MGTLFLSAFCALVLNLQSAEIKKDTIHKYVIDKQVVENFNGTQLEGKTISKYIIAYKNVGNVVEKNHVIFTGNKTLSINGLDTKGILNGSIYEGLIVVDGKEIDRKGLNEVVKTGDMVSVDIHKPGSKVADSYGEKGKKGVLMIVTKAGKASNGTIYFIDGRRVEKAEVDKLLPGKIASIRVNKKDGSSVVDITVKK
ncbi:MAG: hypothetical protein E7096_03975 [Bacteroides sp.]|nr:hypothetical protein [Bacteroides sp.]